MSRLEPGAYRVHVSRYGYRESNIETVVHEGRDTEVRLELAPVAVELEEIVVQRRFERFRHEPTLEGLYARRLASPSMGNNRVLLRTDPEFRNTASARDLAQNFKPAGRSCYPYLFWNGAYKGLANEPYADGYLDISTVNLEGFEYYRDYASLPMGYRELLPPLDNRVLERVRRCGVIALWGRR